MPAPASWALEPLMTNSPYSFQTLQSLMFYRQRAKQTRKLSVFQWNLNTKHDRVKPEKECFLNILNIGLIKPETKSF